jgi:putative glutamine amidotransferase
MKRPLIGISTTIDIIDKGPTLGQQNICLNQNYIRAILKAGGNPILLPTLADKDLIQEQIGQLDGLMLSGGCDVHPFLYGEEPHPDGGFVRPERDFSEIEALHAAYQLQKPIFGICRGMQLMNVAFGGTLYQDLSHAPVEMRIQHAQTSPLHEAWHSVEVLSDTHLCSIIGKNQVATNSSHHQSIKDVAKEFVINAKSKDGIIEGIEKKDYSFFVGVQWHPERMIDSDMLLLFKAFVSQAAK